MERMEAMAYRCGALTELLMMAAEQGGRLKPHQIEMFRHELERNIFDSDAENIEALREVELTMTQDLPY